MKSYTVIITDVAIQVLNIWYLMMFVTVEIKDPGNVTGSKMLQGRYIMNILQSFQVKTPV